MSFSQILSVIEANVFALIRSAIWLQKMREKCSMLGFRPANSVKLFKV